MIINVHLSPSLRKPRHLPPGRPGTSHDHSSFLPSLFVRCWVDVIEVLFERIAVTGPEAAEGSQPRIHLHERLRIGI